MYIGRMRYIVWIIVTTILGIAAPADADEFRIAVRAIKGNAEAMSRWQATADYLNQTIPQHHFTLVPFENNSALNQSISNNDTQLSMTNPASSVELKMRYGQQLLPRSSTIGKATGMRSLDLLFLRAPTARI